MLAYLMNVSANMNKKAISEHYRKNLKDAIALNESLDFPNKTKINPDLDISDDCIDRIGNIIHSYLYNTLIENSPNYWGASCQTHSTQIFAFLTAININSDIVYGEVKINKNNEFNTTIDNLIDEYKSDVASDEPQMIHAWVSIGGDLIIDSCLPDRITKHYGIPRDQMPPFIVGRAKEITQYFKAEYIPMLVGTDFLAKTNPPNPLDEIEKYKILKNFINIS